MEKSDYNSENSVTLRVTKANLRTTIGSDPLMSRDRSASRMPNGPSSASSTAMSRRYRLLPDQPMSAVAATPLQSTIFLLQQASSRAISGVSGLSLREGPSGSGTPERHRQ